MGSTLRICAAVLMVAAAGCGSAVTPADAGPTDGPIPDLAMPDMLGCARAPSLAVTAGSTTKVCQLTGETDRQLGKPAPNQTLTRFGLSGANLGASFDHGGKTWFLFGDALPTGGGYPNPSAGDAIASSSDADPTDCVGLDFVARQGGSFLSPTLPGVDLGLNNVPLAGVSSGAAAMYVWFSSACMTRSVLARSDDGARTFSLVHTLSDCSCDAACTQVGPSTNCQNPACHFVNLAANVVAEADAGALPGTGARVVLFGSGQWRKSNVFLATTSLSQIEDKAALRYFAGSGGDSGCAPKWSDKESDAVPLFNTVMENKNIEACVGELSVHFDAALGLWIAMYNCGNRLDVRAARVPWGPWSDAQSLFDPAKDAGYCQFIYNPKGMPACPQLSDPDRLGAGGGAFAPYAIRRYSTKTAQGARLYFTMSPWNPYNTLLMQTELVAGP